MTQQTDRRPGPGETAGRLRRFSQGVALSVVLLQGSSPILAEGPPLERIELPEGFEVSVFATGVDDARSMARGDRGTIFVGSRTADTVTALRDTDGDGRADERHLVAEGLRMPNGLAFRDGSLTVAAHDRILRFDDIEDRLDDPPPPVVLRDDLPDEASHGWKYIAFGPDGLLYVPVGAPCNVCDEPDPFATILRMRPDGTEQEVLARGVRNTVGFDWHPRTGELWFTDNGRDWMDDDRPPDELNRVTEVGQHFGFPHCHGNDIPDPKFGEEGVCDRYREPELELGPHVAALAAVFYEGESFPEEYRGRLFIAEHGSWNRSSKIGYRIMQVDVSPDGRSASNYRVFAEGWLDGEETLGRPVDLLVLPDGSMLVSDDYTGSIVRISYVGGSSDGSGEGAR